MAEENQTDPYADRRRLTFEQAEGAEPLPSQLKPKELSPRLRAFLWEVIYSTLKQAHYEDSDELYEPWETIFYTLHIERSHKPADEFENSFYELVGDTKSTIMTGDYLEVFGWIQSVLRCGPVDAFAQHVQAALKRGHAAYRIVDSKTIVPIGSTAEQGAIEKAFADLSGSEFHGARKHLHLAAENLTAGQNADSIRESIHAVESVVRSLEPKGDFGKALAKLEAKTALHGALKTGFNAIYGFTSDQEGIRHPLLEKGDANVDEADALFMIGACAAFVSYLINKARAAGILTVAGS